MGKDFKFLVKPPTVEADEIPDENLWWNDMEVEAALERAGEQMRQANSIEVLRDRTVINDRELMNTPNASDYIEEIKNQQAFRIYQALIQENYIDFQVTSDYEGNTVIVEARLKVQRINS